MTVVVDVVVDGKPHPLQRARSDSRAGHHYDTAENVVAKQKIQWTIRWSKPLLTGPLRVSIACGYKRARPTADVDNLAKTCLDACTRYVWVDDRQVMSLHVAKTGGLNKDFTHIIIETLEETA